MIADYSETLSPPPKPFLINQHFVTVILISVLVGLFNAYLQKTAYWAALGWLYIWAVASTTILAGLILDGIRTAQARDIQVRRFLKRAQIELEYSRVGEVKLLAPEQQVAEDTPSARPSKASV